MSSRRHAARMSPKARAGGTCTCKFNSKGSNVQINKAIFNTFTPPDTLIHSGVCPKVPAYHDDYQAGRTKRRHFLHNRYMFVQRSVDFSKKYLSM